MDVIKSEKEDQQDHSTLKEGIITSLFLSSEMFPNFFPSFLAKKYETGFFTQLYYLCSRRLWVNLIDLTLFWSRFILFAMMGVIIGSVYFQMGNDQDTINVCDFKNFISSFLGYFACFFSFISLLTGPIGFYFLYCNIFIIYVYCSHAFSVN